MRLPVFLFLIVLAVSGCQSGGLRTPSTFAVPGLDLQVATEIEGGFLELRFDGQVVDRWGLWIENGDGRRVEPMAVGDGEGGEVEVGAARAIPVAGARFSISELGSQPWTLHVLPRARPAWRVLLAEVDVQSIDRSCEVFGYRRERWFYPDGGRRTLYARLDPDGDRIEVSRKEFEEGLRPSLARVCSSIPETVRAAIEGCPGLIDVIAGGFEAGARYRGPAEGENQHPHARGEEFWSRARRFEPGSSRAGHEDPVDTLVWFLVELSNAEAADAYRRIWKRVLDGSLSEEEYLNLEALQKAAHLRRAVRTLRANADCLDLAAVLAEGGRVFSEYERWVKASRGDQRALARIILRNPARYRSNPAEADLTYAQRLRGLYREFAPISAARSGW